MIAPTHVDSTEAMAAHKRGPWSQEEDERLSRLVQIHGAHYWVRISQLLGTRSPKQCRERYHQNLKPSLNHSPITPEEGREIERMVGEMGKRWAEIARRLHGRSDNAVKNWWNGGMNRRRRMARHSTDMPQPRMELDEPGLSPSMPRRLYGGDQDPRRARIVAVQGHYHDPSVVSPSTLSEMSRADSAESAPSLISDSCSMPSRSPGVPSCTPLELPPIKGCPDHRRSSMPILHVAAAHGLLEGDAQLAGGCYARPDAERRKSSTTAMEPHTPRPSVYHRPLPLEIKDISPDAAENAQPSSGDPTGSPSQVRLPSFQVLTNAIERPEARDDRMTLSSLLEQ